MLGRPADQGNLFSADTQYLDFVGADSLYGFLTRHGRELFPDDDFAAISTARASVGRRCHRGCWQWRRCCRRTIGPRVRRPPDGPHMTCAGRWRWGSS